jgi:hypothetical protein
VADFFSKQHKNVVRVCEYQRPKASTRTIIRDMGIDPGEVVMINKSNVVGSHVSAFPNRGANFLTRTGVHQFLMASNKPNFSELAMFGVVVPRTITSGPRGGRPGTAYYLNEEQALLICLLSKTERAKQVRAEVIRVFTAWRRGELVVAQPAMPDFTNPVLAARAWVGANCECSYSTWPWRKLPCGASLTPRWASTPSSTPRDTSPADPRAHPGVHPRER